MLLGPQHTRARRRAHGCATQTGLPRQRVLPGVVPAGTPCQDAVLRARGIPAWLSALASVCLVVGMMLLEKIARSSTIG